MKKRNFMFLIIIAVLIGALVTGGGIAGFSLMTDHVVISTADYKDYKALEQNYGKLDELRKMIETRYYIPVDSKKLEEGMYKGLFAGIGDPYSAYLTKEEYDELMISTTGEYQGIGVTIAPDSKGYINVVAPMDGSPAEEAGIKSGDKILSVNGVNFNGETIDAAAAAMRGKVGTQVKLSVLRNTKTLAFDITRSKITMATVTAKTLDGNIGYIRISSFEENTAADFKEALQRFETAKVKGLVIDLRDNPGGLVNSAVEIADALLPAGVITYTENRKGEKNYYKSKAGETDLPYTVLVNSGSASSSEILTAAIKDYKGGAIIGTTTYGKGIIQEIDALKDGGATKLTVMQYFSPKGHIIHKVGIKPDYVVELKDSDYVDGVLQEKNDRQLQKAVELLLSGKAGSDTEAQ